MCEHTGLSPDDVVRLHTAIEFTVYAVGMDQLPVTADTPTPPRTALRE